VEIMPQLDPRIEYRFTEDAKVAIVQSRSEALFSHADAVGPQHLGLGVIHRLNESRLDLLFPDRGNFAILCRALGGTAKPAPVIPEHIGYQIASYEALDGATRLAAESPAGPDTHPLHILLGIFRPWSTQENQPAEPDQSALALAATGLSEARLRELLPMLL
jgi:hypothetical protein